MKSTKNYFKKVAVGKNFCLVIIGVLLFILGFLYGRENVLKQTASYFKETHLFNKHKLKIGRPEAEISKRVISKPVFIKHKFFSVQIGSFREKKYAINLVGKLKGKGYDAFLEKVDLERKGIRYRVRVGKFLNKEVALKEKENLKKKENLSGFIIGGIK